jgi:hypothetical protein
MCSLVVRFRKIQVNRSVRTMRKSFAVIPTNTTINNAITTESFRFGKPSLTLKSTFVLLFLLNSSSNHYSSHGFFVTPTTPASSVSTSTTTTTTRMMSTSTSTTDTNRKYNAIVKNQKVPGLKHGMNYIQLGDSDLMVSKICCKCRVEVL